ncbi:MULTISPECIES: acyl carrier protein [Streptomycetaceae]|uniref:acyl carrier protein n=1 Tax=Streptomycetaceae TaxID=2062 RepID=UPI0030093315
MAVNGPTLEEFTRLCADILGVPELSGDANFFEAGGDSIGAAQLAVEVDERWGVQVDMLEMFAVPNLSALHAGIREASGAN